MRLKLGIVAACLLGLATPASALVQLSISGTLQVNKQTVVCGTGPSAASCNATYFNGVTSENYSEDFVRLLVLPFDLKEGDNDFSDGALRSQGVLSGTITNTGGVLTGKGLTYSYMSSAVPTIGTVTINGSARTFAVAAVPEPASWALMLMGFLAVGSVIRRQPRRALLPA